MKLSRVLAIGSAFVLAVIGPLAACDNDPIDQADAGGADASTGDNVTGDAGGDGTVDSGPRVPVLSKSTSNGSSIALSADESRLVVANRDKGSVSVFSVAYPAGAPAVLTKVAEVDLGAGSEPWQVAIDPVGDRAYVALRQAQKLVRVDGIDKTPVKGPEVAVGSEPTSVALSPRGSRAYVANFVDGTVSVVETEKMTVAKTIDLNGAITSLLGSGIAARPALAHPRSLAVSNNGNDDETDEVLYATEFYAVRSEPEAANGSNADSSKRGVVYRVKLSNDTLDTLDLAPLADMGFAGQPDDTAGCFPNALQSITLAGKYAYVLSVCASPRGPLGVRTPAVPIACPSGPGNAGNAECNAGGTEEGICQPDNTCVDIAGVKTTTAPLLTVIDTSQDPPAEVSSTSLNQRWFARYVSTTVNDDASRRLPLMANDLTFVPGTIATTPIAYATANGTNAAFRMTFNASGALTSVGSNTPVSNFIDLTSGQTPDITNPKHGLLPTGAVAGSKNFMFVANDVTRNVSVVDLGIQAVAGAGQAVYASSAVAALELPVLRGRLFFNTGRNRWSLRGQGWGACQSCHPDGLSDNVTWYFGRGPRQSTSLDGSFSADGSVQRLFNWSAIFDDVADFEGNVRGTSGGVGAIVSSTTLPISNLQRIDLAAALAPARHDGLNGSSTLAADKANPLAIPGGGSQLDDWKDLEAYIKTIRAPRGARNVDPAKVAAGRTIFQTAKCQGCHGGKLWTTSELFYTRNAANAFGVTEALSASSWSQASFPVSISPNGATTGTMREGANTGNDTLLCAIRNVGSFGVAEAAVAAGGVFPEVRQDMTTVAQGGGAGGATGFSPPSLLGLVLAGPLLHAGQARTLEALFSDTFVSHHRALAANFLTGGTAATEREQLIHFLLSIDDTTPVIVTPSAGAEGGKLCQ
ncbi:MAG: YncE family protein [Deltaproteobacteria bacterium]|nr:YncE family protein [Deltaproteobacteria bacterium]